jgi:pimeloyl-ACP methyl ester carboxylesterase
MNDKKTVFLIWALCSCFLTAIRVEGKIISDPATIQEGANSNAQFLLAARDWNAAVKMALGEEVYKVVVSEGKVAEVSEVVSDEEADIAIEGSLEQWEHGFGSASGIAYGAQPLQLSGNMNNHIYPYYPAIRELAAVVADLILEPRTVTFPEPVTKKYDSIIGRYVYVWIRDVQYRVYFEEAGQGIPLVLQHTAGADSRQWRHLLEDPEVQKGYRIIAYDLPFHGRSLPPTGVDWWEKEYKLDTQLLMDTVLAICDTLELERPVFMGSSVGGYLAPDLAYHYPDIFRAVIGLNTAISGAYVGDSENKVGMIYNHPKSNNRFAGERVYNITSPMALEVYRKEIGWVYSQGAPGIMGGDLYYYFVDHDLRGKAHEIDTSKVSVYLCSGEYDPSALGPGEELSRQIKGSKYEIIKGASHFAMSDDYERFRNYLIPVLEEIRTKDPKP